MAVFYNEHSGEYHTANQSLNPLAEADFLAYEALLHTGIGWHEYASVAAMNAAVKAHPGWPQPTSSVPTGVSQTGSQVGASIPGLSSIGDFFSRLTNGNTWIRIGEVLLGLILVAVGLARVTHAVPVATQIAKAVA